MKSSGKHAATIMTLFFFVLVGAGCATTQYADEESDPWQGMNRGVYGFNDALDKSILEPVATAYVDHVPEGIRNSITNFFDNLGYLNVILNDFLQGKFTQGGEDIGRFIVNSTLGIGGLFDLAGPLGMPAHEEDFGQTLAVWGSEEGAYMVLPLLGPNSVRDAPDLAVSAVTNVTFLAGTTFFWPFTVVDVINTRANLLPATRLRDQSALDPYVFTREAYRQRREYLIFDGDPPLDDYEELEEL